MCGLVIHEVTPTPDPMYFYRQLKKNFGTSGMFTYNLFDYKISIDTNTITSLLHTYFKIKYTHMIHIFDSYHEIGTIDLRNSIDRVLEVTEKERLIYIGFSEGTTEGYVLLSMHPEYNKKISLFVSLAPIGSFTLKLPPIAGVAINNLKQLQVWMTFCLNFFNN